MERTELAQACARWRRGVGTSGPGPRLIAEAGPANYLALLAGALAGDGEIFLGDPAWSTAEHEQAAAIIGAGNKVEPRGYLMVPTGGTSGRVRFARHDGETIAAAVEGFRRHFGLTRVNAVGVLPLHHVSGLMAAMRAVLTGGEYFPAIWKQLEAGRLPALPPVADGWVISLVPTQLERLLRTEAATAWLAQFQLICLGGGPAWPALLDRAAERRLAVSPGYGMTESAAMVAALPPAAFLAGARSSGAPLPHVAVEIGDEGVVTLAGESLFRGYYPEWRRAEVFSTADLGRIDERGQLHLGGRRDSVIVSGGEKVDPFEVEAVLRATGEVPDIAIVGVPDAEWGELVVAAYPGEARPDFVRVAAALASSLAPAKRPKKYVPLTPWPVTAQGKISRAAVVSLVQLKAES